MCGAFRGCRRRVDIREIGNARGDSITKRECTYVYTCVWKREREREIFEVRSACETEGEFGARMRASIRRGSFSPFFSSCKK